MNTEKVAICENSESEKVVKFLELSAFNTKIIRAYNNGDILGFYYKNNIIHYYDIWGGEHEAGFDLSGCN